MLFYYLIHFVILCIYSIYIRIVLSSSMSSLVMVYCQHVIFLIMKVGTMNTKEFNTYEDKEQFVQGVFSNIAKHYDLMNTLLSRSTLPVTRGRMLRAIISSIRMRS